MDRRKCSREWLGIILRAGQLVRKVKPPRLLHPCVKGRIKVRSAFSLPFLKLLDRAIGDEEFSSFHNWFAFSHIREIWDCLSHVLSAKRRPGPQPQIRVSPSTRETYQLQAKGEPAHALSLAYRILELLPGVIGSIGH
jgi:hypothetical protein